jgi:hypothetical protein
MVVERLEVNLKDIANETQVGRVRRSRFQVADGDEERIVPIVKALAFAMATMRVRIDGAPD